MEALAFERTYSFWEHFLQESSRIVKIFLLLSTVLVMAMLIFKEIMSDHIAAKNLANILNLLVSRGASFNDTSSFSHPLLDKDSNH